MIQNIKYVDIFVITNKIYRPSPLILEKINSYDRNVQLTVETEKDKALAFIHEQLIRSKR